MNKIRIWFYNPQQDTSGFVNKLVSRLDPPFCHCEMQFSDNNACSIYMGSNVVFKERAFPSSNYTAVDLDCAPVSSPPSPYSPLARPVRSPSENRVCVVLTPAYRYRTRRCMNPRRSMPLTVSALARFA